MKPETILKRQIAKQLNNIIERENISTEVASWIAHSGDNPNKIPLSRLAQHIKAAITGRASIVRRRDTKEHERLMGVCDEINRIFPYAWRQRITSRY